MRRRTLWLQMVVATVLVMVLPAAIVGVLSARGAIGSLWAAVAVAAVLALALTSAGSAYWRRHASGDVLFSDLLLWGWLRRRRMEGRLARADEVLAQAQDAEPEVRAALLDELGAALDAKDTYLDGHSRRVARYAEMTARKLDLPDDEVEQVKRAALIHDIGKLHVPEAILRKPGRLTDEEFEVIKTHAAEGGRMTASLGETALAPVVRAHHERFNGRGYPDGLAGEQIPLAARIIGVADTFDAITGAREYKQARTHAQALEIIAEEAGEQLDPGAAQAFISCYSGRGGAALWAGLASVPRQLAERLSLAPGELVGAVAAVATSAAVVVAGAGASALAVTSTDDTPAAVVQAAETARPSPSPSSTPSPDASPRAPAATVTVAPPPAGTAAASTPAPAAPGAAATAAPSATPRPSPSTTPTPAAGSSREPEAPPAPPEPTWPPSPLPPFTTPEPVPTLGPPVPEPTPLPSPTPIPTPTAPPTPTPTETPTPHPPHTADDCKDGGWVDLGYENQGDCVSDANG